MSFLYVLIDWWAGMNRWVRFGVPLFFLVVSGLLLAAGRIWVFGWIIGVVLLLGASSSAGDPFEQSDRVRGRTHKPLKAPSRAQELGLALVKPLCILAFLARQHDVCKCCR